MLKQAFDIAKTVILCYYYFGDDMEKFFTYKSPDIEILYKYDEVPNPSVFKMHTHEFYELYYFAGGNGIYRVEGTPYPLEKGDILIMRPNEAHYIDIKDDKPYTRLSIIFKPEIFDKIDPERKLLIPYENREIGTLNRYGSDDFINDDYRIFINKLISPCTDRHLQTITNLFPLLYEIYNTFESIKNSKTNHALDYRIISYINRHISDDISISKLCNKFFISESQLSRIFKKATASTVGEYITVKRLVNARQLILSGTPPTKAYLQCGFKDYSVFYRAYKKKYGISPSEFTNEY